MSTIEAATGRPATLEEDLDELASLLPRTFRGLKQASPPPKELRDAAERGELGPRHMPALLALAASGPLSVSELSQRLGLSLSSTSAIVGRLSRAGLVERAEDDADRRRTIVRLDDAYSDLITTWAHAALRPLRGMLARLPPAARAHFMEGFRILHEEVTRAAPEDGEDCLTPDPRRRP